MEKGAQTPMVQGRSTKIILWMVVNKKLSLSHGGGRYRRLLGEGLGGQQEGEDPVGGLGFRV